MHRSVWNKLSAISQQYGNVLQYLNKEVVTQDKKQNFTHNNSIIKMQILTDDPSSNIKSAHGAMHFSKKKLNYLVFLFFHK